jgi:hypothetical protein
MLIGASSRGAGARKSLLQRLAPLETGVFLPATSSADRPSFERQATHRGYPLRTCFGLGFASSCISGGVALLVLQLVDPVRASLHEIDGALRVSAISLLSDDLPPGGRQLWWRLPVSAIDRFTSADNLPDPRPARVAVGSLGYPQ